MGRNVLIPIVLGASCVALFARTVSFDFVSYDDFTYVQTNPHLEHGLTLNGLRWAFAGSYFTDYIPVTQLTYLADYALHGRDPGGYHLTNLLFQVLNTLLLYVLLLRLTDRVLPAALVALLFAVHPLHVESVAWISSRKDLVCTFFWFLSLHAYVTFARRKSLLLYGVVAVAYVLGMLSKPMILTLPAQLLLLDYWPLARHKDTSWTRLTAEKLPLVLIGLGLGALTFYLHRETNVIVVDEDLTLFGRIQGVLHAYAHYLSKTIWPVAVMPYYARPADVPAMATATHAAFLLVATLAAFYWRPRSPWIVVGWLWFLATLLPVAGIIQNADHAAADRYTDVPLIGLYIAFAWTLDTFARGPASRRVVATAAALLCVAFGARAYVQTGMWRDSETLYTRMLAGDPENRVALENLAQLRFTEQRYDEALDLMSRAVAVRPNSARLRLQRAGTYRALGRLRDALADAEHAVAVDPLFEQANVQRAELLEALAGPGAAAEAYAESLERLPDSIALATSYAAFLLRNGRLDEAQSTLEATLARHPESPDVLARMGDLRIAQRRFEEAEACYREAVGLGLDETSVWLNLANMALRRNELDDAERFARAALRLQPNQAELVDFIEAIQRQRLQQQDN